MIRYLLVEAGSFIKVIADFKFVFAIIAIEVILFAGTRR